MIDGQRPQACLDQGQIVAAIELVDAHLERQTPSDDPQTLDDDLGARRSEDREWLLASRLRNRVEQPGQPGHMVGVQMARQMVDSALNPQPQRRMLT